MEERLCRVCLSIETNDEFTKIFEKKLALKIFLITSVKILESQNFPALICKSCELEVYKCMNFRKKIQSSQEYFDNKCMDSFFESHLKIHNGIDQSEIIEEYLEYPEEEIVNQAVLDEIVFNNKISTESTPMTRLSCKYCGLKLSRRQRLIQHERLHFLQKSNKYMCDKCGKTFNQRFGLIPHFQNQHDYKLDRNKEKWKCAICEDKILPPGNMEVHYQKFHKEFYGVNNLMVIDSKKSTKAKPRNHLKKNGNANKLKKVQKIFIPCEICGNTFTTSFRYQKHLNDLHGIREQVIIKTDDTIVNFTNEHTYPSHKVSRIQQHTKKFKKYPCSTCGKMFANLNTCKTHEKIHSGLRFLCDLCGSSFSMKPYLTSHVQKVHLKLKRYKCSMCTKTFVHRELLNYHIKKHLNIRNYSCQFCQKTFVRKACAMIHERIHKNERPYSCKYCDRQFIHHSDHRRHELRHTNDIS